MAEFRTSIIIDAKGDSASRVVEELRKKFGQLGDSGQAAGTRAAQGLSRLDASAKSIQGSLNRLQGLFAGIASTAAVLSLGRSITQVGVAFEGLQTALKSVTGSAEAAQSGFAFVRQEAQRLGLSLEPALRQFVALSAAAQGTSLAGQGVRDIFTSLSEASVVLGLNSQQLEGALVAVQQIISKGVVSAEELRGQLGERLFGAFQVAARAVGLTTQELGKLLEQGLLPAERFLPAFARQLRKEFGGGVEEASKGARAEIERFNTALTELRLAFARSGFLDSLTSSFSQIAQALADPGMKDGIRQLGGFIGGSIRYIVEHARELAIFTAAIAAARIGASAGAVGGVRGRLIGGAAGALAGGVGAAIALPDGESSESIRQRTATGRIRGLPEAASAASSPGVDPFFRGLLDKGKDKKLSRLPTLRQEFDESAALIKDALERESKLLTQQLEDNLVSIRDHFTERDRISQAHFENETARIQSERRQQEDFIAALRARQGSGDPNQEAQIADQIAAAQEHIKKLDTELIILGRQRSTERTENARSEASATKALTDEVARLKAEVLDLTGATTPADIRASLTRQFADLRKQLQANSAQFPDGEAILDRAIDVKAKAAEFSQLESQFNASLDRMRNVEQSASNQRQAGLISESRARLMILDAQRQAGAEVEHLIPRVRQLGEELGPGFSGRVGTIVVEFERLKTVVDDVALAVNGAVRDAFQGMFQDIASGAKSAKDILLDFFRSIEQSITKIASQKLADQLFGGSGSGGLGGIVSGLFGGVGTPGSANFVGPLQPGTGGGFLATLGSIFASLFHDGGVVGQGGPRRMVDPSVFLQAPRMHMGGLAGLGPNEVPAILERGERVLPRDQAAGVNVTVNINTPDAGSFRRSQGQVQADIASAVARGMRYR